MRPGWGGDPFLHVRAPRIERRSGGALRTRRRPEPRGRRHVRELPAGEPAVRGHGQRARPRLRFNEAICFLVNGDDQAELDRYADALSAVPEAEQCGWVKDRFGLSWQISPADLDRMMTEGSDEQVARVTQAFLSMKRLDLTELQRAYDGHREPI
jgi:hypothetical protein